MKDKLFSYNYVDTPIHRLSGLTKLSSFLLLTSAVMFSYDPRTILFIMFFSIIVLKISKIKFSQIKIMVIYVAMFILINAILTFLFSPEEGVSIYGTKHVIIKFFGSYILTWEQIFYQITKVLKYASVIPLGIIFLLTTNPSEFASALNGVGVPYKAAFAVSLTLRYFPDIQRHYRNINLAQQARGLDMSHKTPFLLQIKNHLLIIIPLVFSTLDRIELISNAMDLRSFGKLKKRTWYSRKNITISDILVIIVSFLIFIGTILVSMFLNHGRFYNPFI